MLSKDSCITFFLRTGSYWYGDYCGYYFAVKLSPDRRSIERLAVLLNDDTLNYRQRLLYYHNGSELVANQYGCEQLVNNLTEAILDELSGGGNNENKLTER